MAKSYRPFAVPSGVDVKVQPGQVVVKGKLGTIAVPVVAGVVVKVEEGHIVVDAGPGTPRVHVGSLRAHIGNALVGVAEGYRKVLQLRGMGYKAQKTKEGIQISCGFSHVVDFAASTGVTLDVNQVPDPDDPKLQMFEIVVSGADRHAVGQLAATIQSTKPPDVYRGKGIRYKGQYVRKKQGKRAAGTQQA
ncbi:50S ribosomal protein L6 [candidate division WOR-3 bacterium]|nr:50S ribosomal protein L6 [candidate division WOR-3 bacterium]